MDPLPEKHVPDPKDRVPLRTRLAWGSGGFADNCIMNVINILGMVIYVDHFRLDPFLAGVAMFFPRFFDAITDPLIGNFSDNARTRWGRRRPFILGGAIMAAVLMPLLWMPPFADTGTNPWYANGPFIWLCLIGSVYTIGYTFFVVPYTALGYELTTDYDEKTRVISSRFYFYLVGSLSLPWIYRLCKMDVFPDEAVGARWVSVGFGLVVVVCGLLVFLFCQEKKTAQKQATIAILPAIKETLSNRPFIVLMGAYLVVMIGLFSAWNLGLFINIFYVAQGDKALAGNINGTVGTVAALFSFLGIFLIGALSKRMTKKTGFYVGLTLTLMGMIGAWFAINPRWPWGQLISNPVIALGLQGSFLMIQSMVADICDEDELVTGRRREGMFGAVMSFTQKLALAFTTLIGGYLIGLSGFDAEIANTVGMPLEVGVKMKSLVLAFQAVGIIGAMLVFIRYPISRERAAETRRILDERKKDLTATETENPS